MQLYQIRTIKFEISNPKFDISTLSLLHGYTNNFTGPGCRRIARFGVINGKKQNHAGLLSHDHEWIDIGLQSKNITETGGAIRRGNGRVGVEQP